MRHTRVLFSAVATSAVLALVGCSASSDSSSAESAKSVTVGIINSYTGGLANFGPTFEAGYRAGIKVLTNGSSTVNGVGLDIKVKDDGGDPATGTNAAKELLGAGAKMIVGTTSSAVNLPLAQLVQQNNAVFIAGSTGTAKINGLGPGIFRSGWDSDQYVKGIITMAAEDKVPTLTHIGQDYALGQGLAASVTKFGTQAGLRTDNVLLPVDTQDFTAGVARALAAKPAAIFVSWAGTGTVQLFAALKNQGVFNPGSSIRVLTVAPNRSDWASFANALGPDVLKNLTITNQYAENTTGTAAERDMLAALKGDSTPIDTATANGYLAAQMTVKLVKENGTDLTPAKASASLSGARFDAVVGPVVIRPEDHVALVPVPKLLMVVENGAPVLKLQKMLSSEQVSSPPVNVIK